jgi:hypothetical protein
MYRAVDELNAGALMSGNIRGSCKFMEVALPLRRKCDAMARQS